jgi:hypothetical protein
LAGRASTRRVILVGGLLQALDVELVHLHQRRHDPARFRRVAAVEQFIQGRRNDLP